MRLLELYLKAFGPFTERRIELPDVDGPGLCVLYGANEAGKSTALRAIRGLLYGIPSRSPDDFIHRYSDLRLGARMRFEDGEELAVMRRKKSKDSLYTYDDSAVLDKDHLDRLDRLAEDVPELLFERFYGLDHRSLSDGSEQLLADDGEVGRALFGASLGLANLSGVLAELETEAAELFAPRANTRRINAAIAEWKDAQKEIKSLALDPKQWQSQERVVREGEDRLDRLTQQIEDSRTELSRIERVKRSLPALSRRHQARDRLEELAGVSVLPEDFELRLVDARASRVAAGEGRRRASLKIERETAARQALALAPELVDERERIEAIHQQVEGYTKTLDQLPRREAELARLDREIEELIGDAGAVSPERIASLRAAVNRAGLVRTLANEAAKFEDRVATAREDVAEAAADLERLCGLEGDAGQPAIAAPATRALAQAVRRAVELGPTDERLLEQARALRVLEESAQRLGRRLGLETERLEEIEETPYPAYALIESMSQRFADLATRRDSIREEERKLRSESARIDEELSMIRTRGVVPKLEELEESRGSRNQSWSEIRRIFVDGEGEPSLEQRPPLADRFERESAQADDLADQMRRDAKQVAEQGALEARHARVARDLSDVVHRKECLEGDREELQEEWLAVWERTGIEVQSPEVMRSWHRDLDELRTLLAQQRESREKIRKDEMERSEAIASLRLALPEGSGTGPAEVGVDRLDGWIGQAEVFLEREAEAVAAYRKRQEAIERATDRSARAQRQLEQAEVALDRWGREWSEAIAALELKTGSRPEEALERIERMQTILERLRERDQLVDRVEKMAREVADFEASAADLIARSAPQLAEDPPGVATLRLHRMLGDSLKQQILFEKCAEALAEAREELEEAEAKSGESARALDGLRRIAEVQTEEELDEALRRWREVEAATRSLQDAESEIENLAEGRTVAEIESQSMEADPDVLAARIETLGKEMRALAEDQAEAIADLRSQRDRLAQMDGSGRVAELAEAAASKLAGIRRDVERYVQLRMAKQILEREIERYRSDNQAPLLTRASELFASLTRDRYPRITTLVGEDGSTVQLVAVTQTGSEVPVEGLSAGTRDQLFLSLRLASLEESLDRGEPMPLIADDILIEFDDDRTRATLEVLAQVGQKVQIFLFSHHRHVAEIAKELGGNSVVIDL